MVVYIIQQLLEQGHLPSDIFILSGSVKGLNSHIRKMENALCERGIPCHIPTIEQDKLDERVIEGKIVFSTFHCVKGRQRKFVFVVGFDHNYFLHMAHGQDPQVCPNTLYVGCTRAMERLYLLEFNQYAGDRPLEFLKMTHHDMVAADFVEFKGMPQTLFYDRDENGSTPTKLKNIICRRPNSSNSFRTRSWTKSPPSWTGYSRGYRGQRNRDCPTWIW
jgi:superfamily I DNA/RNA helicase